MTKEKFMELGLEEEMAAKAAAASKEELKDFVAKDAYDTLQQKYDADTSALTKQMADHVKNSAVDKAIMTAKGRNPKAIKALLDMDKITVKEDGTLEGLDLEALKESDKYLFEAEETKIVGTGAPSGSAASTDTVNSEIAKAMGVR